MRRWSIWIVDDREDQGLEDPLSVPFYSYRAEGDQKPGMQRVSIRKTLRGLLPEEYCTKEEEHLRDPDLVSRRLACQPRRPIIDVSRTMSDAWDLLDERTDSPPDIVFLDICLSESADKGDSRRERLDEIRSEIQATIDYGSDWKEPLNIDGKGGLLDRGGLFLLGKIIRLYGNQADPPRIVLYSQSGTVHTEFLPWEYALNGQLRFSNKNDLRSNAQVRRRVIEERLSQWLKSGDLDIEAAWRAVRRLEPISGTDTFEERKAVDAALTTELGQGWLLGTFFVYQAPILKAGLKNQRSSALAEIRAYLEEVEHPRQLMVVIEDTPLSIIAHPGGKEVPPEKRSCFGRFLVDGFPDVVKSEHLHQNGLRVAQCVMDAINRLCDEPRAAVCQELGTLSLARRDQQRLDATDQTLLHALSPPWVQSKSKKWADFRNAIKWRGVDENIAEYFSEKCKCDGLTLSADSDKEARRPPNVGVLVTYMLPAAADATMRPPLSTLLDAIIESIKRYGYGGGAGHVTLSLDYAPAAEALTLTITDSGSGFGGLERHNFASHGGNLSGAIRRCRGWLRLRISSGRITRDPMTSSIEVIDGAEITGCQYQIRFFCTHGV